MSRSVVAAAVAITAMISPLSAPSTHTSTREAHIVEVVNTRIYPAYGLRITEIQHGTKNPNPVEECRADHATCTISAGETITSTISSNVGVSFEVLNASLGYQYQKQYTVTTSCPSPTLARGQVWTMYPRGDFVFFSVNGGKGTAFLPTGVFCEIRSDWQ